MALVRSKRELGVPLQLATPPIVGPGRYAADQSHSSLLIQPPTAAPFSSTAPRSVSSHAAFASPSSAAVDTTPGPGSYRPSFAITHYRRPDVPLAAFASNVDRFAVRRDSTPGPAAYHVPSHLNATGAPSFSPSASTASSHSSITASHRAQSAPSIPSAHTSHGYSTEQGKLVAQPPPQHSVDESPSPAAYNPVDRLLHPAITGGGNAIQYSKTKQHRFHSANPATATPGPAHYNPHSPSATTAASLTQPSTGLPSSSFLATGRATERPNTNPGVGTYQLRGVGQSNSGRSHSAAPFGVSSGRSSLVDRERLSVPGPTAYDARVDEWHAGGSHTEWTSEENAPAAFASSSTRFPAPAVDSRAISYNELVDYRLERQKTSFSHIHSFGSLQPRFTATDHTNFISHTSRRSNSSQQSAVGPATYKVKSTTFKHNKLPSAAFHSETRRFSLLSKEDAKVVPDSPRRRRSGEPYGVLPSAAFASHSTRFGGGGAGSASAQLGPGAYYDGLKESEEGQKYSGSGSGSRSRGVRSAFVSRSKRWNGESDKHVPAPGQYATERSNDGLVRRSFNVTIG